MRGRPPKRCEPCRKIDVKDRQRVYYKTRYQPVERRTHRCLDCDAQVSAWAKRCTDCKRASHNKARLRASLNEQRVEKERERDRRRYADNPTRQASTKIRVREWWAKHPEASVHHDRRHHKLEAGDATRADVRVLLERTKRCPICKATLTTRTGRHVDHIIPLSTGGRHTITNLRVTCAHCNLTRPKDGRDLDQLVLA